jgi:hypothetical protein
VSGDGDAARIGPLLFFSGNFHLAEAIPITCWANAAIKKKPRAVDARGYKLLLVLRLFSILTVCLVGERGTPFGSEPLEEVTFKPTLRFTRANTESGRNHNPAPP